MSSFSILNKFFFEYKFILYELIYFQIGFFTIVCGLAIILIFINLSYSGNFESIVLKQTIYFSSLIGIVILSPILIALSTINFCKLCDNLRLPDNLSLPDNFPLPDNFYDREFFC